MNGRSLVHCMAGKDRTGFAVGLLHRAMGVHQDDVIADYMLTNIAGDIAARIPIEAQAVRETFGVAMDDEQMWLVMSVQPEYLQAAMDAIEARHGGVEAYLRDHLGIDRPLLDRIAARIVA